MEQDGVWNINGHALPPPSSIQIMHRMHHQLQQGEEEEEKEKRKKMKLNSSPDWLGLADKTYHNFSTKDIIPSFPNTRSMDHPFLQLHPYHHHHHHHHQQQQQQQVLPEMAIAKSSLEWQLGSNMRIEDNQSIINPTHDFRGSSINLVSNVDGGGVHKWYNNSSEEEWERRAGLRSNDHMVDPTGFLSNNNIHQSFMNYTGNTINSNNNNNTVLKGGGSSSRNSKDRHSKVFTAKGIRDRRIRFAASTATQFYDIQDRLGYQQPSKAVDWLMSKARASIDQLPRMEPYSTLLSKHSTASLDPPLISTIKPNSDASHHYGSSTSTHQIQDISGKPHAGGEKEKVGKVVSGVEMRLADETSPPPSLPSIRTIMSFADASSSSSFPSSGL